MDVHVGMVLIAMRRYIECGDTPYDQRGYPPLIPYKCFLLAPARRFANSHSNVTLMKLYMDSAPIASRLYSAILFPHCQQYKYTFPFGIKMKPEKPSSHVTRV
jgi:hypothetical protein